MKPPRIDDLPVMLQEYVRHGYPKPSRARYTEHEYLLARQLRRAYFRNLQLVEPGMQYGYPDFEELMRPEIMTYVRRALKEQCLKEWDILTKTSLRLNDLYAEAQRTAAPRLENASAGKRVQILREVRQRVFLSACYDPRTLGEIEFHCTGRVFYGMPHWRNYDPSKDD